MRVPQDGARLDEIGGALQRGRITRKEDHASDLGQPEGSSRIVLGTGVELRARDALRHDMHPVPRCSERDQFAYERAARRNHGIGAAQLLDDALTSTAIGQRPIGPGHVQHDRKSSLLAQAHSRPAVGVRPGAEDRIRPLFAHASTDGGADSSFERRGVGMFL